MEPAFRERQRLTQWWIRLIAAVMAGIGWWAFTAQILLREPWGTNPAPDWVVWLIFGFIGWGIPLLLLFARLVVTVDDEVVRIRWYPFAGRTIRIADIDTADVRTYRPLLEYGGWGVRWSPKNGTAWNASGNRGVQLVLVTGKRVLIGSQRSEELRTAIRGDEAD